MKDLIDRQAAIDELRTCQTYLFDTHDKDLKISLEDAEYCIERLPSAQPERKKGRWIPCSERLPEVTGSYLVTVHPNYIMPGSIHVDMLSWFDGKWWFDLDGQDVEFPDPIIAWMPMPEPYKGGEEHE